MEVFDYDDIELVPRKCNVSSRSEISTQATLGKYQFNLPVVPANMATIIDESLAIQLAQHGYFYIMHRFNPDLRLNFVQHMHRLNLISSISVGVKPADYNLIKQLAISHCEPDYITIDIAHGYADSVLKMISFIKQTLPHTFVIAGNIATPDAVQALEQAGADATKVGIGPGRACITKLKTGFGTAGWQLAAINACAKVATRPIIADGGIRNHGDIAKSLRFGATFCMIGSLLAGHEENPGTVISVKGHNYKTYFGSASFDQKGTYKNVEGKKMLLPYRGSIFSTLQEMTEDLQSAVSYAGGTNLEALAHVDYVKVTSSIHNGDITDHAIPLSSSQQKAIC